MPRYTPDPRVVARRTPPEFYRLGELLERLAAEPEYVAICDPRATTGVGPLWKLDELTSAEREMQVRVSRYDAIQDQIYRGSTLLFNVWRDHGLKPPPTEEPEPSPEA